MVADLLFSPLSSLGMYLGQFFSKLYQNTGVVENFFALLTIVTLSTIAILVVSKGTIQIPGFLTIHFHSYGQVRNLDVPQELINVEKRSLAKQTSGEHLQNSLTSPPLAGTVEAIREIPTDDSISDT